jgi:hypothetical protein
VDVDHNETHDFRLKSTLSLIYTSSPGEQVEKELESSSTAGKIRIFHYAGVAQLVEHFLAKEDVASSSLVTRFCSARDDRRAMSHIRNRGSFRTRSLNSCRLAYESSLKCNHD